MLSRSEMRNIHVNSFSSNDFNHQRHLCSPLWNWYINHSKLTKNPIYLKVRVFFFLLVKTFIGMCLPLPLTCINEATWVFFKKTYSIPFLIWIFFFSLLKIIVLFNMSLIYFHVKKIHNAYCSRHNSGM